MSNNKIVIVINKRYPIPLRHIVDYHDFKDIEDFKKWYYEDFVELVGDEFIVVNNSKERDAFLKKFYKEQEGADNG